MTMLRIVMCCVVLCCVVLCDTVKQGANAIQTRKMQKKKSLNPLGNICV